MKEKQSPQETLFENCVRSLAKSKSKESGNTLVRSTRNRKKRIEDKTIYQLKLKNTRMEQQFVICINNKNYTASLELGKVYPVLRDEEAESLEQKRIIDESGEDYLYPNNYFVAIEVPKAAREIFSHAV
jgi:hypothetical protein